MKRAREKKWYYVYGNLTQRFADSFYHSEFKNIEHLLEFPSNAYKFETSYPIEYGEYSLKDKHYIHILHTVILDFLDSSSEELFDIDISTIVNSNNTISLYCTIQAKRKYEEVNINGTATQKGSIGNDE